MKRGLLILFLILLTINVNAAIKTDASIISFSNENGNIIKLDKSGGTYNYTLLKTTAFGDWVDSVIVDTDGDGNNEIAGLRDIGKMDIYLFEYKDNEVVEKLSPLDISNFPSEMNWIGMATADTDNNKKDELILGTSKLGRFYSISYQGNSFYTTVMGETRLKVWDAFDVGDIDGDKIQELVLIRQADLGNSLYLYKIKDNKLGEELNYGNFGKVSFISLKIVDIDDDGINEIISLDKNGQFYSSKIKNGEYSQTILTNTGFSDWIDMDYGDVDQDSKNELVALARQENPFYIFKYNSNTNSLVFSLLKDYTHYLKWNSISVGKFTPSIKQEIVAPEPKIEEINETIQQPEPKIEEPIPEIKPEVKESSHSVLYILLIIIALFLFLIILIFLTTKYEFQSFKNIFKRKEQKQDFKKIEQKEEIQEDIWPETRKSKDLRDMKEFIKAKKSNK
ncbi:MAG: hypothetical protein WC413_04100 [Candidatus Nanoarchaeia archaeon]